ALLVGVLLIGDGCKRTFLTPTALSSFTPAVSLTNPTAMAAGLEHTNTIARGEFFSDSAPMLTESIFSDVAVEGTTDKTTPAQDLNVRITPTANLNNDDYNKIGWYWQQWYQGVRYANTIISRIDNVK